MGIKSFMGPRAKAVAKKEYDAPILVSDYMTQNLITFRTDQSILEVMELFTKHNIVQKNINMGIQMPHDSNRPPFHKDTPHSSNHELVIWIPLVNCYKTMCMHMFDRKFREKAVSLFSSKKKDRFEKFAKIYGSLIDVNFGEAIIFSADNFHNIPINKTNDTRWSLNIRFKNLYTPYGERNILDYFEIIKMSCVTKLLN